MQPFTHPELLREIHDAKISEALGEHDRYTDGWSLGVVDAIRRVTGRFLVAAGTRLAPAPASEVLPGKVVEFPSPRASRRISPSGVADTRSTTDRKPAA